MKKTRAEIMLRDLIGNTAARLMQEAKAPRLAEPLPTLDDTIVDAQFMILVGTQTAAELEALSDALDDLPITFNGFEIVAEFINERNDHE